MIRQFRHMVLLLALTGLFCSCTQVEDARHAVAEADSLRAVGMGYDGNGNRVWRLKGDCNTESQNGETVVYRAFLDDAVLYPNPYLTITPTGYTKHYYIGSERVATALGEGGWKDYPVHWNMREEEIAYTYWGSLSHNYPFGEIEDLKFDNVNETDDYPHALQYNCPPLQLNRLLLTWNDDLLLSCILSNVNPSGNPEHIYYTHSDHLGSASWITDFHGDPVQYIHYAPYGELLANQRATGSTYDERYKFTGKERDVESGYDYYGARYQIVPLGIWGSPDPLLDKTIHMSSYMYCNGNPIVLRDPDGNLGVAAMILIGAGVGAVINGGIALYNGKSMSEVGAAALGGAIAGAITAATGTLGGANIIISTIMGSGGGAIGGAAGSFVEQGINIATGNQDDFDEKKIGTSAFVGSVTGAIGGVINGVTSKAAISAKNAVSKKYLNNNYKDALQKEVSKELKSTGQKSSYRKIKRIANERIERSQQLDEKTIEAAKASSDIITQVGTTLSENEKKY